MYDDAYASPFETRPAVVTWFKVYAGLMTLVYLIVFGVGLWMVLDPDTFVDTSGTSPDAITSRTEAIIIGCIYGGIGGVLGLVYGVSLFLRRGKAVWIYDLVLICIGLTSCLCMPATIPLLIYWIKPETKDWFYGVAPAADEWGTPGPGQGRPF